MDNCTCGHPWESHWTSGIDVELCPCLVPECECADFQVNNG